MATRMSTINIEPVTLIGIITGLFGGSGAVILFVDKQRRSWIEEVRKDMQREIDELKAQRVVDQAKLTQMDGRILQLEDNNREARAGITDVMVGLASDMAKETAIEGLRAVTLKLH